MCTGYECADVMPAGGADRYYRINPMGTEFMTRCRYVGTGPAWTLVAQEVRLQCT